MLERATVVENRRATENAVDVGLFLELFGEKSDVPGSKTVFGRGGCQKTKAGSTDVASVCFL